MYPHKKHQAFPNDGLIQVTVL